MLYPTAQQQRKEHPDCLSDRSTPRKKISASDLSNPLDDDQQTSIASLDDDYDDAAQILSHADMDDMLTPDDVNTPDELEESIMERKLHLLGY